MAAERQPTVAAIDIGSNSIKMTVGRPAADGSITEIGWGSEVVRLGYGIEETGRLDEERIERGITTLKQFAAQAHSLGATEIIAVATEATRRAVNGLDFLERVRKETGI